MQFHYNGFQVGDPDVAAPSAAGAARLAKGSALPSQVDVLIIGSGPAGLTIAAQLAAFPDIDACIVEQRSGPLELGQADGIACRTVEMFNAFGFAEQVLREAYWVNETTFWRPAGVGSNGIVRGGQVKDTEPGLSEFPHVILNQARVHGFYLDLLRKSPNRAEPYYGWRLVDLQIDRSCDNAYPISATFETLGANGIDTRVVSARYAVGCDGARSEVRRSLGLALEGDSANQIWGVMDVLVNTDFPDLRKKSLIRSADGGSVVLIPREGGFLSRFYVELGKLEANERASRSSISLDQVIDATRKILFPWSFEVKDVAWWSAYEIGQRLCPRFDNIAEHDDVATTPCVFIAGDACHTHSPKAGQGMNVSMQDGFNLGWKLASVLLGRSPKALLKTYSTERYAIAKQLIDFDREWAGMLSTPLKPSSKQGGVGSNSEDVQAYFVKQGHYTAGTATQYATSMIVADGEHQHLATGFPVGKRLHSAPVIRLGDARAMHLGHTIKADGRWRIFIFAGREDPCDRDAPIWKLCEFLQDDPMSPLRRFTPAGADSDAVIDVMAIFQQPHDQIPIEQTHPFLVPAKGQFRLPDREKMFCPDFSGAGNIFELRGIHRQYGCMLIVRPDQHVANILPLNAHSAHSEFFEKFLLCAKNTT